MTDLEETAKEVLSGKSRSYVGAAKDFSEAFRKWTEQRAVLSDAIRVYGKEAQTRMVVEEMAELMVAMSHFTRHRATEEQVLGEIADVLVVLEQLAMMTDDGVKRVLAYREAKIERLRKRLADVESGT